MKSIALLNTTGFNVVYKNKEDKIDSLSFSDKTSLLDYDIAIIGAGVVGGMSAGRAAECPTAGTFDTFESNHQFTQHTAAGVTDIDTEG